MRSHARLLYPSVSVPGGYFDVELVVRWPPRFRDAFRFQDIEARVRWGPAISRRAARGAICRLRRRARILRRRSGRLRFMASETSSRFAGRPPDQPAPGPPAPCSIRKRSASIGSGVVTDKCACSYFSASTDQGSSSAVSTGDCSISPATYPSRLFFEALRVLLWQTHFNSEFAVRVEAGPDLRTAAGVAHPLRHGRRAIRWLPFGSHLSFAKPPVAPIVLSFHAVVSL